MNEPLNPSEQKALESLISAVLHQFGTSEAVSDKEIDELLRKGYSLSEEQKSALAKLGDDPLVWVTKETETQLECPLSSGRRTSNLLVCIATARMKRSIAKRRNS